MDIFQQASVSQVWLLYVMHSHVSQPWPFIVGMHQAILAMHACLSFCIQQNGLVFLEL